MTWWWLLFLLSFVAGGISSLLITVWVLFWLLGRAEAESVKDEGELMSEMAQRNDRAPVYRNGSHETPNQREMRNKYQIDSKNAWIQILSTKKPQNSKKSGKISTWSFAHLKSNMLFWTSDENAACCSGVIRLDGCIIDVELKKKKNKPSWTCDNPLILSHEERELLNGSQVCFMYFKTARELEDWYYVLQKAALLEKDRDPFRNQRQFFSNLSKHLTNRSLDVSPHWVTAILCRLWWNIHSTAGFIEFVRHKLQKKIDQVQTPSFVESIKVKDIGFGPELPIIKEVQLVNISDDGAVEADGDLIYYGGFHLTIEIVFKIPRRQVYIPAVFFCYCAKN